LDIGEWLRSLGLQSYEQMFKDNGIDLEVLPHLTAEDLKEIGVRAVGHRRKILDAIGIPPAGPAAVRAPPSAERRQLTLMFVDLVGSTDLSRRIDPEELRDIMRAYQNTVAGEIARLEGHVAKFLGDGILAYFGWPRAREDAAERAVRGGLAVAEAVGGMVAGVNGHLLQARVGIATGLVVVGDLLGEGAAKEEAVTGETPNLAARVQQAAEPGTVVIADSTRRLVGDLFELVGLGALAQGVCRTGAGVARHRRGQRREQVRGLARGPCHAPCRSWRGTRVDVVTLAAGGRRIRPGRSDFRRARDRKITAGACPARAPGVRADRAR
jgi:class 3 adenylate cyclase